MIAQPPPRPLPTARTLAILILAAGASQRLGRPKQLVRLAGEALVRRVVRQATSLRPAWIGVVIGARSGGVRAALASTSATLITARHWRRGMACSLVAGVRAAPRSARHLAILSVDQWRIDARDLRRLCARAGRVPVAAQYSGRRGVPAVFPRHMLPALLALRGDQGARALLQSDAVRAVAMPAAAEDLDTPADLRRLRARGART
ncbi:MAG: nucleotidyltransferase family protein [Pseudomonadota bacterium]